MNSDTVTTITQVIKSLTIVVSLFGVNVSPESTNIIIGAAASVYAVAGMIQGWFTNKKVS